MHKIIDAQDSFLMKLQALYDIENELAKALPKLAKAAKDPELSEGFRAHLEETKEHTVRLERIFMMLGIKPKKARSEGIRGIIEDGAWVIHQVERSGPLKDAMLAGAARYAEHHEMAGYMTAIEEARFMEMGEIEGMLMQTLAEEEAADRKLERAIKRSLRTRVIED
jgi:ferritin-like metal-binding protein YciE